MLQGLFENKNIVKILIFIFVNEKCYGTQIQSFLKITLTSIRKNLQRLEKDKILISCYEGKLRLYELNPTYPLRSELEALLKKSYDLLSCEEKKTYCFIDKSRISCQERIQRDVKEELLLFWEQLKKVNYLSFSAKSKRNGTKSTQIGKANVQIFSSSPSILVFQEKGYWLKDQMPDMAFNNSFRWTLDLKEGVVTLEHLRYGPSRPVFLFQLAPKEPYVLEAVDAHLCAEDTYLGIIVWNKELIDFHWRVVGPLKNDELVYRYSFISSFSSN